MEDDLKPPRSWQEITYEASRESDPDKLEQLSEELERALDQRARKLSYIAKGKAMKRAA